MLESQRCSRFKRSTRDQPRKPADLTTEPVTNDMRVPRSSVRGRRVGSPSKPHHFLVGCLHQGFDINIALHFVFILSQSLPPSLDLDSLLDCSTVRSSPWLDACMTS